MSLKLSLILLVAILSLFTTLSQAACETANGAIDGAEECDGGLHCTDCTCDTGFVPQTPVALSCIEACFNPVTPLSTSVESSLTVSMDASQVDFHALVLHQTTSTSGNTVTGTEITFGTGSICDFPDTTFLGLQTLDTDTCFDDYAFNRPFADFSPCLVLTCLDNNDATVSLCDPALCLAPPCRKRWANPVKIERNFNVFNDNNVSFAVTSTAFHNVEFQFPWIQSTSFNSAAWATPNIAGSAVITAVIYDPLSSSWSVVVSSSLNWPYQLVKPVPTDGINGQVYTVSACSETPDSTVPCVQTISFSVDSCDGLSTVFGGVATSFTGLKYECADFASPDCPLAAGDIRDATINVVLDSDAPCGPVVTETIILQSDLAFDMRQPDYAGARTSFIEGDVLNFRMDISKTIPAAAISSISVVSFKESVLHPSVSLATLKVTTPEPCGEPNTLCFTFDTSQLTDIPDEPETDLTFVVIVQIDFSGISKKRAILEISNYQLTTGATAVQEPSDTGSSLSVLILGSILVSLVSYLVM